MINLVRLIQPGITGIKGLETQTIPRRNIDLHPVENGLFNAFIR